MIMMTNVISAVILFVSVLHFYFLYLEMFQWTRPLGLKTFKNDAEFAKRSAVLAANQGLYNGFLAAGLIWSVFAKDTEALHLKIFFLLCVLIAGIYGGYTVNKRIFFIQGMPALIALALLTIFA
jgi:putative membrane protein